MLFTIHHAVLERALHAICADCKTEDPLKRLVEEGLRHVMHSLDTFDAYVSPTQFADHFFERVGRLEDDDGSLYFDLFEDLAIFFREKVLRNGQDPASIEQRVLEWFETQGEWQPGDGRIISEWYWSTLPILFAQSSVGGPAAKAE